MCGRFANNSTVNELIEAYVADGGHAPDWRPSYNVAPTQEVPVVRQDGDRRILEQVRWGMVAPYAKEFGGKPVINARIETVATNGMFKGPFLSHRVIVPALGYYEWQQREDGKQPFFIRAADRQQLHLAGIVREWHDRTKDEGDPLAVRLSMSIITLDAHVTPGEVHDREPAFVMPEAIDDWLGGHLDAGELEQLLLQSSETAADGLEYYEVTRSLNASRVKGQPNSDPSFIEPL